MLTVLKGFAIDAFREFWAYRLRTILKTAFLHYLDKEEGWGHKAGAQPSVNLVLLYIQSRGTMSVPLYAPTPIQPAHPTPFYIENILGRTSAATSSTFSCSSTVCSTPIIPTPTIPSPAFSFTSLISPYRTTIYEPSPIHHAAAALTAATYASAGTLTGSIYPFQHQHHRSMGEYAQTLLRHGPIGKLRYRIKHTIITLMDTFLMRYILF